MKTLERKQTGRKASTKNTPVITKPFTVPQDWQSVSAIVSRADMDYLESQKLAGPRELGSSIWVGVECHEGGLSAEACAEHATVSDPVKIVFEMEDYLWQMMTKTCADDKLELGSVIRLVVHRRCIQVRKFRKTKAGRVDA